MKKPKILRPWLLPPSKIDSLPKGHQAFFLLDLIDQLDLDPILQLYRLQQILSQSHTSQEIAVGLRMSSSNEDRTVCHMVSVTAAQPTFFQAKLGHCTGQLHNRPKWVSPSLTAS